MRILLVTGGLQVGRGGVEEVVYQLGLHFVQAGHRVMIFCGSTPDASTRSLLAKAGIGLSVCPLYFPRTTYRSLLKALVVTPLLMLLFVIKTARFRADVINCHYLSDSSVYAYVAARVLRKPLVLNVHGADVEGDGIGGSQLRGDPLWRRVAGQILFRADLVICNSEHMKRATLSVAPFGVRRIVVIPNGVEDADSSLEPPPHSHTESQILYLGRLVWKKGVDTLLAAMPAVQRTVPTVELVIAGDGPERSHLEGLAGSLGVAGITKFVGWVSGDVKECTLRKVTIVVVPSRLEPFGIVPLEAMVRGVPVVASRVGGIPEVVRDGVDGLLVEPDQPKDLADAIIRLLTHDHLRTSMGREGRMRVQEHFLWSKVSQVYLRAFEDLVGGTRRRA